MTSHTYRIIPFDGGKRPSLPISSRQIDESISIADFFPPNCRVDFFPPNCRFYCRFLPAKYIIVLRTAYDTADFRFQPSINTNTNINININITTPPPPPQPWRNPRGRGRYWYFMHQLQLYAIMYICAMRLQCGIINAPR